MRIKFLGLMFLLAPVEIYSSIGNEGGGGDGAEIKFHQIRMDILDWIDRNGSKSLFLPTGISVENYNDEMRKVLIDDSILVTIIDHNDPLDEERQVGDQFGGQNSCRGFIGRTDNRRHIVCARNLLQGLDTHNVLVFSQYFNVHNAFLQLTAVSRPRYDKWVSQNVVNYLNWFQVKKMTRAPVDEKEELNQWTYKKNEDVDYVLNDVVPWTVPFDNLGKASKIQKVSYRCLSSKKVKFDGGTIYERPYVLLESDFSRFFLYIGDETKKSQVEANFVCGCLSRGREQFVYQSSIVDYMREEDFHPGLLRRPYRNLNFVWEYKTSGRGGDGSIARLVGNFEVSSHYRAGYDDYYATSRVSCFDESSWERLNHTPTRNYLDHRERYVYRHISQYN